jgi:nicotinate-nucleotide adenylyltransferase
MKVGVLGGTFDPVHFGHLRIAEEAQRRIDMDTILFIPAGQPWIKINRNITPAVHRVKMIELAIDFESCFEMSTIEIERKGPSYTVDTMAILQEKMGVNAELFFILGWDSLVDMVRWKEPAKLVKICRPVAVTRANVCRSDLRKLEDSIPGIIDRTIILDMPPIDISSSDIRRRAATGLSLEDLVPIVVAEYIAMHDLYSDNQD